jgi:predicted HTH domain antitoxin
MKVKSIRIPQDIDNALEYVSRVEKIDKTQSFRKLARMGFEYYVCKAYAEGKITLRETSELLSLTLSQTIDLLLEMGVAGNIRSAQVLESLNSMSPTE